MAFTDGSIVTVTTGTNTGKKALVIGTLSTGRVLVYVEGEIAGTRWRDYLASSLAITTAPAPVPAPPAPPAPDSPFQRLVLNEQFDTLDRTRWSLYDGAGHAGNGLRDPSCWWVKPVAEVEGATGVNCLVGTAWWDAAIGKMRAPGMSLNRDSLNFRIECRARVEPDPSGVTAANMPLLWPKDYRDDPYEEVNPYETSGPHNATRGMSSFVHYGAVASGKPAGDQVYFDLGVDGTAWHVVTYERRNGIRESCWVDGVHKWTVTDPKVLADRPHHPALQLDCVSHHDPGKAIHMFIDWLRLFEA